MIKNLVISVNSLFRFCLEQ